MIRYSSRGTGSLFDGFDYINETIVRKHLTKKEVALKCGIAQSRFSNITNGWDRPRKSELTKLIAVLDLDLSEWRKQSSYVREMFQAFAEDEEF